MSISELWEKINKWLLLPVVAGLIALGGFAFEQYKDYKKTKTERIAKQLVEFYAPMNAMLKASGNEWRAFRSRYASNRVSYFDSVIGVRNSDGTISYSRDCNTRQSEKELYQFDTEESDIVTKRCPISSEELKAWTLQMKGTFKPYHDQMEALVLKNRYLVGDDYEMNLALDDLLLHINGYKLVFSMWTTGDYSQMTSHINFPSYIEPLVEKRISQLSSELDPQYANIPLQDDAPQAARP